MVQGGDHPLLAGAGLVTGSWHWLSTAAARAVRGARLKVRYRQNDQPARLTPLTDGGMHVAFEQPQRAVTPGQYAVAYEAERCLGGGGDRSGDRRAPALRRRLRRHRQRAATEARYNRADTETRMTNSFRARSTLKAGDRTYEIWSLAALPQDKVARLPFSLKILLENLLRCEDGVNVTRADIEALLEWNPAAAPAHEIAFTPGARDPAGFHRRAVRGRSGGDARRDRAARRQSRARQSAQPRGAGHRSLGAGR